MLDGVTVSEGGAVKRKLLYILLFNDKSVDQLNSEIVNV